MDRHSKKDIQAFVRFLKIKNVYSQYRYNLLIHGERCISPFNLPKKWESNNFLSYAFRWSETEEGHKFWLEINNSWLSYYFFLS